MRGHFFLKLINGILLGFEPVRDFSFFSDTMRHSPHLVVKQEELGVARKQYRLLASGRQGEDVRVIGAAGWSSGILCRAAWRCCMIQLRREWGRFSNFSFRDTTAQDFGLPSSAIRLRM